MSRYEEKKQARIERYEELAGKNRIKAEQNSISNVCGEKNTGMPMGQPILVGHHSEKRHRRHLERIDNQVRKGFEAQKKADHYDSKAASAENRTAIDSDDPEAVKKIKVKIFDLERCQTLMKSVNKIIKRKKGSKAEKVEELIKVGYTKEKAADLFKPDFCGRVGFASYSLQNNNANIRRYKQRLSDLQVMRSDGFESFTVTTKSNEEITVELNEGQIQVHFPWKPNEETRNKIKAPGLALKWSRFSGCWVRKHTPNTGGHYFSDSLKDVLSTSVAT